MLGVAGLLSATAGGVLAYFSARFPAHIEKLETAAGVMVIAGFALASCSMPTMI
jgi:hypothetical protein